MGLNFTVLKKKNLIIADKLDAAGLEADYALLRDCATYVSYKNFTDGREVLNRSNFCKNKFCCICNQINAYKQKRRMREFLKKYNFNDNNHYHLIITLKNCELNCIKKTIKTIKSAWTKMIRRVKIKKKLLDYSYYVHVEYNKNKHQAEAYNVHIHVLAFCNKNTDNFDISYEHDIWENCFYQTFRNKKEESGYSIDYKLFVSIEKIESPEYLLNLTVYCARGIDITDVPVKDLAVLKMQLENVNLRQSSQHLSKLLRDQERKSKKIVRLPHCIRVTKWSGKRYEDAYAYDPVTYNTIVD